MRLFVAITFSPALQRTMAGLLAELRQLPVAVKWVPAENIHLTLKFLGEVERDMVGEIGSALRHAARGIAPWHLEIIGTGVFPNWRNPRVIWLGVDSSPSLLELQQKLTVEYQALGFAAEPFTPHLTLGRLRPGIAIGPLQDKLRELAGVSWGREKVAAVSLMESRLAPRGASYRPLVTVTLPVEG